MPKTLYTQVGQVSGKDAPNQVTFTHQFTPPSEDLKKSRGNLFTLVTLYGDPKGAANTEKDIYQTLQSTYYSQSVGSNLSALESALDQVIKSVNEKNPSASGLAATQKIDLVAAVLWGEALYLVKTQNPGVILQRGQVNKIIKFYKTASGALKNKDTVCLVNRKFLENVDVGSLESPLGIFDFQESLKSLNEVVGQVEGATTLVFRIYVEQPKQEALEMVELKEEGGIDPPKAIDTLKNKITKGLPIFREKATVLGRQLKSRLGVIFLRVFNKILEPWRPREPGHLEDPSKRRRARVVQVAAVLIVLLVLSVSLALVSRTNSQRKAEFADKLGVVEARLVEIENLAGINPERSKELLAQVEQKLKEAKDLKIEDDKLEVLEARFKALLQQVDKVYEISLENFYSFDVEINSLIQVGNSLIVLDKEGSKVLLVDKGSKEEKELLAEANIGVIADFENALYLQGKEGIKKFEIKSSKKTSLLGASSKWGEIVGADTYEGNLYLLDRNKKEVWKYLVASSGLGSPKSYFKEDKPDLGELSAIAIDGAVWLGNKDGAVFKFLGGRGQKFEIDGLDKPFGEIADIYTKTESSALFILDKSNKRVVLLKKDGEYLSQHTSDEFGSSNSLVVDEKNKTIYVGVGNSIKSFKYE